MGLRRLEPTVVKIGEMNFYITPFGAFKAANLTGELASVLAPLLGALAPVIAGRKENGVERDNGLLDIDAGAAAEALSNCTGISGDRMEKLMRKLLLGGNIVVELIDENTGEREVQRLTADLADEVFCGEIQDMFLLCFHVIKLNFNGFFKRLGTRSGKEGGAEEEETEEGQKETTSEGSEPLIMPGLASWS